MGTPTGPTPEPPATAPGGGRRGWAPYELDHGQCIALLGSAAVGRIVLHGPGEGAARVLPVDFVLDVGHVVVRTGDGVVLAAARAGRLVTFQADAYGDGHGWSVTVAGLAHEATGPVVERLRGLGLSPLAGGVRDHFVLVPLDAAEGWRVGGPVPVAPPGGS